MTPSKWGRAGHNLCDAGVGTDNTCTVSTLDTTAVQLFGLNTDAGVNGDDKFYIGLKCY